MPRICFRREGMDMNDVPKPPEKLSTAADPGSVSVADQIALGEAETKKEIALGEHGMKKGLVTRVTTLFFLTNLFVFAVILLLLRIDYMTLSTNSNATRVVDKDVLQWLIGATVIQTGMIMAGVAASLFPKTASAG